MPQKKKPKQTTGGSDTARRLGLTGIVAHFTPEDRKILGAAAALTGESAKAYLQRVGMEAARRDAGALAGKLRE